MLEKTISVIIPAHNEERYVTRCIRSVKRAARHWDGAVEIIVVCNRCTDKTQAHFSRRHSAIPANGTAY